MKITFKKFAFFILVNIAFFCLSAATPQTLNIADFPSEISTEIHPLLHLQDQMVQVRGFWYPVSSEQGVLASHAGLRSCCLTSPIKIHQQLIVKGPLPSLQVQRVVNLKGIFKIEPLYNEEGQLVQFYVLEDAQEVQQANSYAFLWILGFLLTLLCLWRFLHKRKMSR